MNRFATIITGAVSIIIVSWTPPNTAWALHELDCSPIRASVVDAKTGRHRCLALSLDAQKQVFRTRKLLQEQKKRTRNLLLQKKQLAKKQKLIEKRERVQQKSHNRRHADRQRLLESNIERRRNQLEQRLELPRSDLLDDQKALNRRLKKDQQGQ